MEAFYRVGGHPALEGDIVLRTKDLPANHQPEPGK